jgi:hypothetical protein
MACLVSLTAPYLDPHSNGFVDILDLIVSNFDPVHHDLEGLLG